MNFKIRKKELLESLNVATKAISTSTPLPSLAGIKFEVENNTLVLISSDSSISIKNTLKNNDEEIIEINENGKFVIDAKYIVEIVRKIESEKISFETIDGNLIKIYGGNSEFKINCIEADEYPDINFEKNVNPFTLKTNIYKEIIEKTSFACSDKEIKPVLTGVNFKANGNVMECNATDSYRLAKKIINLDEEQNFDITVPAKHLVTIYHSINDDDNLNIYIDQQKIIFESNNILFSTRLLDDQFPDISKLIPTEFSQELIVNLKDLTKAVDRASFIKYEGKNTIKLSITSTKVDITANNQMSSSFETINVGSYKGDNLDISCSGKYLLDALSTIDSENVKLSFSGELKPIIITGESNNDIVQLISPVRTYN